MEKSEVSEEMAAIMPDAEPVRTASRKTAKNKRSGDDAPAEAGVGATEVVTKKSKRKKVRKQNKKSSKNKIDKEAKKKKKRPSAKPVESEESEDESTEEEDEEEEEEEFPEPQTDWERRNREIIPKLLAAPVNTALYTVFVVGLQDLNSQDQTVWVEVSLNVWFRDPSGIGKEDDDPTLFNPAIELQGAIEVDLSEGDKGNYYIDAEWKKHGITAWFQKYRGTIRAPMNLRDFPFDRQVVKVRLASKWYGTDAIKFVNITEPEMISSFSESVNLTEWELTRQAEVRTLTVFSKEDKRDISAIEIRFYLRRFAGYYLKNIISLLFILSVISWAQYIVPPYILNDRLQISITLFLAQVAFNFVVVEQLPKISYGTYLSVYFIMCYALLGVGAVVNVISFLVNRYACGLGDQQVACDTALQIDLAFLGIVAGIHILVTLVYIILGLRRRKGESHINTAADAESDATQSEVVEESSESQPDHVKIE